MFKRLFEKLDLIINELKVISTALDTFRTNCLILNEKQTEEKNYLANNLTFFSNWGNLFINPFNRYYIKFGDEVLCRDYDKDNWKKCLYIKTCNEEGTKYPYVVYIVNENRVTNYKYCIPYNNDTKHLENTTKNF
jgi:hypothetical protein